MIPKINKNFLCIVDRNSQDLAAIISSYLNQPEVYLPMFEYGKVLCDKSDYEGGVNRYTISHQRANEFNIRTYNALQYLNDDAIIILAGLDSNQYSYLDYLEERNVIYINDVSDITQLVEYSNKANTTSSSKEDIHIGLYNSLHTNSTLTISDTDTQKTQKTVKGLVVIERNDKTDSVIAVNYALSIDADIVIIDKPEITEREITHLIESWIKENNINYYNDLSASIYPSIEHIEFKNYEYATFFTAGVPYSLIAKNVIPFTHVNTNLHPDFFLFNGILREHKSAIESAVVFSPRKFGDDEETDFIVEHLESNNYHITKLVDEDATAANLDNYVCEFPFEILHLCSHGGKVHGATVKEEFEDDDGNRHMIEYDEVVSFAPQDGEELISVTSKRIFRKLNGFDWKSKELKDKKYPEHVYESLQKKIGKSPNKTTTKKSEIVDSCSILCKTFFYQAMFQTIAGSHTNPIIFNNTCWSWLNISENFLAVGASGYIGTIWRVNNDVARKVAEQFYENVFGKTVLDSLQKALIHTNSTSDENNYAYWGLHFSTIKVGANFNDTKMRIADKLLYSYYYWKKRVVSFTDEKEITPIDRKIRWLYKTLKESFSSESITLLMINSKKK